MLLSVQTANILDPFGIDEGFRMIAEAGFQGVDLNIDHYLPGKQIKGFGCYGFYDQTDEEILEACRPYKEAAEKHGVRIVQAHAPFPPFVQSERTNAYVLESLKKTIMMCGYLGCPKLVVHPGRLSTESGLTKDDEWKFNIHMYTELIPWLKKYGVICCLENMFARHRGKVVEAVCSDPYEAMRYMDTLNEIAGEKLFGFCLDIGHANLLGKDIYDLIKLMGDTIIALHVHDNNGLDDEHLFPYMGIVDWDRFCAALKDINYAHDLSFETFGALAVSDPALTPEMLNLLGATARLFAKRIKGEE